MSNRRCLRAKEIRRQCELAVRRDREWSKMRAILLVISVLVVSTVSWAKTERTYYSGELMTRMREQVEKHDWARAQVDAARSADEWYLQMSDQETWDFVPPPEQLRAINVCIGHDCPFCGEEITRKGGHYPWIMDRDKPFKVTCPVCGRTFPDNDFEPWNTEGLEGEPESGERIIDTGLGWIGPDGRRYYFVSYYIFWQRWVRDIINGMSNLGRAYLLTGDPICAHKCAVMMTKLASEYERFDYRVQCYHEGRFNVPGRISDRIWSTGNNTTIALAYDAIYPAFAEDAELLGFLKEKGVTDPRQLIEQKMLNVMANDIMSGVVAGNMGMHQRALCCLAIVLDNDDPAMGPTTEQMRDWIMTGPGRVEDLLWNGFWREGLGSESSPSYSSSWCRNFYEIAELLPRLGVDIWGNPKLRKMADVGIDMTVAGRFSPCIGDSGGLKASGPIARSVALQGRAFTHYRDPRHAKALALMNARSRDLFEDYFDEEEVARVIEAEGTDLGLKTRNLSGYGLAVLENGKDEHRRAVTMYYGYAGGGHGHHDRLNIEMWAFGRHMLPEDGYPFPFTRPDFWRWRSTDTVKHYCVVVDETTQKTQYAGDLNTLAATPELQLMDASAEVAYPDMVSLYRRTAALIDVSEEASYLLDIFRVRGGSQHDWCFHGPPFFDLSVAGGQFGPVQEKGTLAGVNVPFGARPPMRVRDGAALDLLAAEKLLRDGAYRDTSREGWAPFGDWILTRCPGATITVSAQGEIPAGKVRGFVRFYDYNEGINTVDVTVAGVTEAIRFEPTGARGTAWASQIFDLPEAASEVVMNATEIGQTYIQIDEVIFSTDLDRGAPRLVGDGTSGYHGLYNVRRMSPEGNWSATWAKADEDLGLTMTMPAGCAQEVIVADASPELQPGNPDVIQYVLGRNELPGEKAEAGEELLSKYVAVIEPHRGPARITGVEHLQASNVSPDTVGVAVRREQATDLIHSSLSPTERCEWKWADEVFVAAAEFALVTLDGRRVKRAVVVNGTLLQYGDFSLRPSPSPQGRVLSVDFDNNAVTIDATVPTPQVLCDSAVILGNELQKTSYTIKEATSANGHTELSFGDVLYVVGMGAVAATDTGAGTITADRDLTGYGRVDGGMHAGRWLYNEDRSEGFRIASVSGRQFALEGVDRDLAVVFADTDGDGRRLYWVSDIGPGDTYRIPTTTYYTR